MFIKLSNRDLDNSIRLFEDCDSPDSPLNASERLTLQRLRAIRSLQSLKNAENQLDSETEVTK